MSQPDAMHVRERLEVALRLARSRQRAIALLTVLPVLLAVAVVMYLLAVRVPLAGVLAVALVLAALAVGVLIEPGQVLIRWLLPKRDTAWLARRLNALRPELEDSAELIWTAKDRLLGLAGLQRLRLLARAARLPLPDLRPAWPWRRLVVVWSLSLIGLLLVALLLPRSPMPLAQSTVIEADHPAAAPLALAEIALTVVPPSYTGLPESIESGFEARVPEGALLRWRLRFDGSVQAAELRFHDGSVTALAADGDDWVGERTVLRSTLYRLHVEAATAPVVGADALHRIDVVADAPPSLRLLQPDRTLSLVEPGQDHWPLRFEASDDHGLGSAQLIITLAHGTGENVVFSETRRRLRGVGDARNRRYQYRIELAGSGFEPGDDLIVRIAVSDNRQPQPNRVEHPSLILRWPLPESGDTGGLEGVVRNTLPAYFRSQRQIIIDTEALIGQRPTLAESVLIDRSDAIGVDQRILRLRYGQFLGEEAESTERPTLPEPVDAVDAVGASDDPHQDDPHDGHDGHGHSEQPASANASAGFGRAEDIIAEYGHSHDHAEATTLFDPQTRALLKAALDAMWQAELHLRSGRPEAALPHEYQALDLIKRVQQATRIYLARVGLELPPIDFDRRLTGTLDTVRSRPDSLVRRESPLTWLVVLHDRLERGQPIDPAPLKQWLAQEPAPVDDPLDLLAAIDRIERDPDCADCARRLHALLWPLLPLPPAQAELRETPSAIGRHYLRTLAEPAAAPSTGRASDQPTDREGRP